MSEYSEQSDLSTASREESWRRLARENFDLLIIGGGITGAAVAHQAAFLGLRVALIEKGDFASGTSSRSTRLIHGGLRYVKEGKLNIVFQLLRERQNLSAAAPHLIRPLKTLLPLYNSSLASRAGHRFGMATYETLHPFASKPGYQTLDAGSLLRLEPLLSAAGLQNGFLCREFLTHDARLVWETILAAIKNDACALNYARAVELLKSNNRIYGAIVRDELTNQTAEIKAKVTVNAAGAWTGDFFGERKSSKVVLSKGVHIVLPRKRLPLAQAVVFRAPDGRHLIAIPIENFVLVGTTETRFELSPDEVDCQPRDSEYLLESLQNFFPQQNLQPADICAVKSGVRPLFGGDNGKNGLGAISREYKIQWHKPGLLSILGGKMTLHRRAAAEVLRALKSELSLRGKITKNFDELLPGADWHCAAPVMEKRLFDAGLEADSIRHLFKTYGSRINLFVKLLAVNPDLCSRLAPGLPFVKAEIEFAKRFEMAQFAADFAERRSDFALRFKAENGETPFELMIFLDRKFNDSNNSF